MTIESDTNVLGRLELRKGGRLFLKLKRTIKLSPVHSQECPDEKMVLSGLHGLLYTSLHRHLLVLLPGKQTQLIIAD